MANTTAKSPDPQPMTRTPYRVKLHHIECCNCTHGCNCQFAGNPDRGFCQFMIGFKVIEGQFGSVELGGVSFVIGCQYPKAIHEGHGRVVLFVDQSARPDQVQAVGAILSGKMGGMPWEALAGTVESFEGPIQKPIEMIVNGTRSGFRIPGILEMSQTPIKDAVSGEEKEIHVVYPKGGFLWDDGNICTTATMKINQGAIRFEHPGGYAAYALAEWTNQK